MGVVYKARHLRLKRLVAVKMILAGGHAGPDNLARFRTETEAIARLSHPNIVQVFEVGEHGETPFFSLEFCGGGSLAMKLAATPLPPAEAAALVQTLARAMQAAHDKGVVHRDLKPANVLLADDGTPKITDFGLAKKLDEAGQTIPGAVMGTPSYMAPEQAEGGRDVGPLADVYALGALLYECLTGRPPFKAATSIDTMMQVVSAEPVPPRRLNPAVPRDLETICLKCLRKEPARRYPSAQGLADDLGRFLSHEPILARRTTTRERFAKWCRRNPWIVGLSGAVIFAVVAWAVTFSQKKQLERVVESMGRGTKEQEVVVRGQELKPLSPIFDLGRNWIAKDLREQPGRSEGIRREGLALMGMTLKTIANDMQLTPFNRVAVHQLLGDFARNLGLLGEAGVEYQQGYDLVEPITRMEPGNDAARANRAVILLRLGSIAWVMKGDVETARKNIEEARALRQEIADHPRSADFTALQNRVALAYSAIDRGRLEFSQGNLITARQQLDQALQARRAWVKEARADEQAMAMSYLSEACLWMGVVLAHQGDQEGADRLLQEALALSEEVARKDPKDLSFQKDLAEIHGDRGDVQALRGDWEGASVSYQKAREHALAAKLIGTPEDAAGQVLLARTIERLAAAAEKKGDAKDARGRREMSLRVREALTRIEPACVSWKAAWLLALAHLDRQAEAEAAAAELTPHAAGNAELLLQLARYHAIRAGKAAAPDQRRAAAERALALLGDAVSAGYADRFTLAGDPDLAPLWQEADYQALSNRLAR
jgi:serine/threonine-protein kinase